MTKAHAPFPEYAPPMRTLGPCQHCKAVVLGWVWKDRAWVEQVPRLSPIFGVPHVCTEAGDTTQVPTPGMGDAA